MSYANTTSHYGLPQYVATDKPKYLTDFNETMTTIDDQMYTNATAAATADSKAVAAKDVADANTASIGTLNKQINGDPTVPSDTGLAGDVSSVQGQVDTINSLIGNGTPTTTDKTIIGAINELNGGYVSLKSAFINALDIGFVNDGITDNTSAFTSLLTGADYEGKTVYFPAGEYLITGSVNWTKKVKLVGDPETVFTATTADDYMFVIDFSGYSGMAALTAKELMNSITLNCASIVSGVHLTAFLDVTFNDITVLNAKVYGLDLTGTGVQFVGKNLKFYQTDARPNDTTYAIYDTKSDNLFSDIIVVGYKIAYSGASMITRLHHWLQYSQSFSGSQTLNVYGGQYDEIYSDTVEKAIVCTGDSAMIGVGSLRVNNSDYANTGDQIAVTTGTYQYANVVIDRLSIKSEHCKVIDDNTRLSVVIKSITSAGVSAVYNNFNVGGVVRTKRTELAKSNTGDINTMYKEGIYIFDTDIPVSNLPSGVGTYGVIMIITPWTNARQALQIVYSSNKMFFRFCYEETGTWREFTA